MLATIIVTWSFRFFFMTLNGLDFHPTLGFSCTSNSLSLFIHFFGVKCSTSSTILDSLARRYLRDLVEEQAQLHWVMCYITQNFICYISFWGTISTKIQYIYQYYNNNNFNKIIFNTYLSMGVLTFDITIRGIHSGTSPLIISDQISLTSNSNFLISSTLSHLIST